MYHVLNFWHFSCPPDTFLKQFYCKLQQVMSIVICSLSVLLRQTKEYESFNLPFLTFLYPCIL